MGWGQGVQAGAEETGIRDNAQPVQVIAHRGASADAPENTLAAFRLAHEKGADWFELDCMLSRDGHVVVIHDHTVDRTTDGAGHVDEMTLESLRALDAGSWKAPEFAGEHVPTLDEALVFAKDRIGVYIEVKQIDDTSDLEARILEAARDHTRLTPAFQSKVLAQIEAANPPGLELARKCIEAVRQHGLTDQVVIQSFSPVVCAVTALEAPEIRVELLGSVKEGDCGGWDRLVRWCFLLDTDGLNTNMATLTIGRLAMLQAAGKSVAVYTVNDPTDMEQLARWGVDAIITDTPGLCRERLR